MLFNFFLTICQTNGSKICCKRLLINCQNPPPASRVRFLRHPMSFAAPRFAQVTAIWETRHRRKIILCPTLTPKFVWNLINISSEVKLQWFHNWNGLTTSRPCMCPTSLQVQQLPWRLSATVNAVAGQIQVAKCRKVFKTAAVRGIGPNSGI